MERSNNSSDYLKSQLQALIKLNETSPEKAEEICMTALYNIGIKNLIKVPNAGFALQENKLKSANNKVM